MNILYLSCHSILEYDELKLFEDLGYDYFSIGAYINPQQPHDIKRPALKGKYHEHLASVSMVHNQNNLHQEQVDWADVIIVMHIPDWIEKNWDLLKKSGKRVIWRTIGQSVSSVEERLRKYREDGLEVVRYSPYESRVPGYIGADTVIRFYKDPKEFGPWDRQTDEVINFSQSMKSRGEFCNFDTFEQATRGLNAHVYGPNNDDAGELNGGMPSFDGLIEKMKQSAVYFYTGTWPASYTLNFIEAFMSGIPIVAIGNQRGNSPIFGQATYEVGDLLQNGLYGYVSDDPDQLRIYIDQLLADEKMAQELSRRAREKAIELFGMDIIKKQWKEYLEDGPSSS